MEYRARKQTIILTVMVLFLAFIGAGFYFVFLKPGPTCADGIKNQDETEIDCGGAICKSCEINTLKDIDVIWVKAILLSNGNYDFAAKILNPNPNFGNRYFRYEFEALDTDGQPLGKFEGSSFILPNETKYLVGNNFAASQPVTSARLKIDNGDRHDWESLTDNNFEQLIVKDANFAVLDDVNFLAQASGIVKNTTNFDFDAVVVSIILFDASGQALGAARTQMNTLRAGEERFFSVKWGLPFESDVAAFDMRAEANLFNDKNYLRVYGAPEAND